MNNIAVGVDPGKEGAIVMIVNQEIRCKVVPKIKKEVDILSLKQIFEPLRVANCHVVLEDVHAKFGSAAKSTFNFGHIVGVLEGILVAMEIPYTKVQPKKWQKEMWEGVAYIQKPSSTGKTMVTDTKAMSLIAVKRLFPKVDLTRSERSKKDHDGIVDALLLAEYCRRNFIKNL